MRHWSSITVGLVVAFALLATAAFLQGAKPRNEMLEYEIISIDPQGWIVTARETATGNVVKFRLPPAVFKGQTFDANLDTPKPGNRFSVRGPRNARLNRLVMTKPLSRKLSTKRGPRIRRSVPMIKALTWEIVNVDAPRWIVTAKNRRTGKILKFKAHPEAFTGFRFRADIRSIGQGEGFSIVTPNERAMENACTLLELQK